MNNPLKLKTKKLFYGKWPYKISTYIQGGTWIRNGIPDVIERCKTDWFKKQPIAQFRHIDTKELLKYVAILSNYIDKDIKIRIEHGHINFFLKDQMLYNEMCFAFRNYTESVTEPESESVLKTLLDNNKFVVVDELPHGKYSHKIIFRSVPSNMRGNILKWADNYPKEKLTMSKNTRNYFNDTNKYVQDPFMYVSDEKMLIMLGLIAQNYIRRTEKFILKSSINTSS